MLPVCPLLAPGIAAASIVAAGYRYDHSSARSHRTEVERKLSAVADPQASDLAAELGRPSLHASAFLEAAAAAVFWTSRPGGAELQPLTSQRPQGSPERGGRACPRDSQPKSRTSGPRPMLSQRQ